MEVDEDINVYRILLEQKLYRNILVYIILYKKTYGCKTIAH